MKGFKHILVIGEESIFGEIAQIITIAEQSNTILYEMLGESQNEKTLDLNMQKIRVLEKKSDDITFRVNEDITTGAVSPNILDHLLECVTLSDDIVDNYYYQSRQISRMCKSKFPYSDAPQEAEWMALFRSLLDLAGQALVKVKTTLSLSDLSEILRLRKEIEALEQQGDDIKDKGFDWLYREAPRMHYLQFHHYSELLHKFDDILDGCEDLSDLILSVITSILK